MNFEFLGFTLDIIGKILIAYTATIVNYRFWKEHRADKQVLLAMKHEWLMGIIGIVLMIAGYFLQLPFKF